MITTKTSSHEITLSWHDERFQASLTTTQTEQGVDLIHIKITTQEAASPPSFTLSWSHPVVDIHANWRTSSDHNKGLVPDWASSTSSKATSQAPVCCFHSFSGQNRLTFAFSDALNTIKIGGG